METVTDGKTDGVAEFVGRLTKLTKLPAFQLYPGDIQKDPGYKRLSKAERGAFFDFLCLVHECPFRGVAWDNGTALTLHEISVAIGGDSAENSRLLEGVVARGPIKVWSKVTSKAELKTSREDLCPDFPEGTFYNRRMLKDEIKRIACSIAGKEGEGNPDLKKGETFKGQSKGGSKGRSKGDQGSSSSSSASADRSHTHTEAENFDVDIPWLGERAIHVAELYPDRASKDNRVIAKGKEGIKLLAELIAVNPDYPWEEHAMLENEIDTPRNLETWARSMPDMPALKHLRKISKQDEKAPARKFDAESDAYKLANFFVQFHADWARGAKPPSEAVLQRWSAEFDLMLSVDGRSMAEVAKMLNAIDMQASGKSGFLWRDCINSPMSLRTFWNGGRLNRFIPEKRHV